MRARSRNVTKWRLGRQINDQLCVIDLEKMTLSSIFFLEPFINDFASTDRGFFIQWKIVCERQLALSSLFDLSNFDSIDHDVIIIEINVYFRRHVCGFVPI